MKEVLNIGELFLHKYRIEKLVGSGGMGAVYAAIDVDLERRVAIKVLLPEVAVSAAAAARFVREARAAARLEGEHVARVFGAGRTPEGLPYMILELLEGVDLAHLLRQRGKLGLAESVNILRQAVEGVAEAHHHGIVHRDLKPANIFLHYRSNGSCVVKVLDFGLSKMNRPDAETPGWELTSTQAMLGSPFYMSPEQLRDAKNVDRRTDIWALGIILHEMLTGAPLFEHDSWPAMIHAILHEPIPYLGALRPEVPEGLSAVLALCLERDLDKRLGHASELARLLAPFGAEIDDTQRLATAFPPSGTHAQDRTSVEVETRIWSPPPNPGTAAPLATEPKRRAHFGRSLVFIVFAIPAALILLGMAIFTCVLHKPAM